MAKKDSLTFWSGWKLNPDRRPGRILANHAVRNEGISHRSPDSHCNLGRLDLVKPTTCIPRTSRKSRFDR